LGDCYESLRKGVVERSAGAHAMRGGAALMFKGMAAWMKCVGECAGASPAAPAPAPAHAASLPVGIERNVIEIMATMVLASSREGLA
jgi:hypothetical protein